MPRLEFVDYMACAIYSRVCVAVNNGVLLSQYTAAYSAAKYWQSCHKRSVEREKLALQKIDELQQKHKEKITSIIADYETKLAAANALLNKREAQLFGKTTEKKGSLKNEGQPNKDANKRKRGSQAGSKGHKRTPNKNLPVVVEYSDLPESEKCCKHCQLPFHPFTKDENDEHATEDSDIIECYIKAHIRRIKRNRYKKTCQCSATPAIITAPAAPRLIPKGKLGISLWVRIILDKYLYYIPTYRLLRSLRNQGLSIAQGTVTDGLKQIAPLFKPLYDKIAEHGRKLFHHQADETRWQVFAEKEGKIGTRWYLWLFLTKETMVYYIDPTRANSVPTQYFNGKTEGILSVDRYSAYKKFVKGTSILLAFCWAHVRRDFLDLAKAWGGCIDTWAMLWVEKIGNIYHLNKQRLLHEQNSAEFAAADKELRKALDAMQKDYQKELKKSDEELSPECKKVLRSLENHWSGLTIFVDYPEVEMDNNGSENGLRGAVLLRNSVKGSGSLWSAELTAMLLSLINTIVLWDLNPHTWLIAFLSDCAQHGGTLPPNWENYLPWNMDDETRQRFAKAPCWDTS